MPLSRWLPFPLLHRGLEYHRPLTRLPVDILGLEVATFDDSEGKLRVAGLVAQRAEDLAALVLLERPQRLPERVVLLREIHLENNEESHRVSEAVKPTWRTMKQVRKIIKNVRWRVKASNSPGEQSNKTKGE